MSLEGTFYAGIGFGVYIAGTTADYITTDLALRFAGVFEKNRITRWFMKRLGVGPGLIVKTSVLEIPVGLALLYLAASFPAVGGGALALLGAGQIRAAYGNYAIARDRLPDQRGDWP